MLLSHWAGRGRERTGVEWGGGSRRLIHGVNSKGSVNYICFAAQLCPCRSPQKTSRGWRYQFQTIGTVPESSLNANTPYHVTDCHHHGHMWHTHMFLFDCLLDDQLSSVFLCVRLATSTMPVPYNHFNAPRCYTLACVSWAGRLWPMITRGEIPRPTNIPERERGRDTRTQAPLLASASRAGWCDHDPIMVVRPDCTGIYCPI